MKIKAEIFKNGEPTVLLEFEQNEESTKLLKTLEKWATVISIGEETVNYALEKVDWAELSFELMNYYKQFKATGGVKNE